jgi:hypothetical protein
MLAGMRRRPPLHLTTALALAVALPACGSTPDAQLPAPAAAPSGTTQLRAGTACVRLRGERLETCDGRRGVALKAGPVDAAVVEATGQVAVLAGRARVVELFEPVTLRKLGEAPAGTGPARIASENDRLYVTDLANDGLLVLQTRPRLRVTRRAGLPGGPFAIANAGNDLVVSLRDASEVVLLNGTSRPVVQGRAATVPGVRVLLPAADGAEVRAVGRGVTRLRPDELDGQQQG